jgi:DNA repair exonuclease SbcCD ATPase subunit
MAKTISELIKEWQTFKANIQTLVEDLPKTLAQINQTFAQIEKTTIHTDKFIQELNEDYDKFKAATLIVITDIQHRLEELEKKKKPWWPW